MRGLVSSGLLAAAIVVFAAGCTKDGSGKAFDEQMKQGCESYRASLDAAQRGDVQAYWDARASAIGAGVGASEEASTKAQLVLVGGYSDGLGALGRDPETGKLLREKRLPDQPTSPEVETICDHYE